MGQGPCISVRCAAANIGFLLTMFKKAVVNAFLQHAGTWHRDTQNWYMAQGHTKLVHGTGTHKTGTWPRDTQNWYMAQGHTKLVRGTGTHKTGTWHRDTQNWYMAQGHTKLVHGTGTYKTGTWHRDTQNWYMAQGHKTGTWHRDTQNWYMAQGHTKLVHTLYICIIMKQQQFTCSDERHTRDECLQYMSYTQEQVNKSGTPT